MLITLPKSSTPTSKIWAPVGSITLILGGFEDEYPIPPVTISTEIIFPSLFKTAVAIACIPGSPDGGSI